MEFFEQNFNNITTRSGVAFSIEKKLFDMSGQWSGFKGTVNSVTEITWDWQGIAISPANPAFDLLIEKDLNND